MIRLSIVVDDTLELALEPELYPLAHAWIPHGLEQTGQGSPRAAITVRSSRAAVQRPASRPTLTLGRAAAWLDGRSGVVVLRGGLPASRGELHLVRGEAWLCVDPRESAAGAAAADLYSMLTISAGLLLAGRERALVHAAGVVDAGGGAWLLAGDARAGKSTTCATLIAAGWGYLSDDQVVLGWREDDVQAQGWLRPFHLDAVPALHVVERGTGGDDQEWGNERLEVSPVEIGLERWRRTAPLAGVIFPVVAPGQPTELQPVSGAEALAGLVRQSPWLLASPRTASRILRLFERVVAGGAFRLRLGLDTYRAPDRLAACLQALATRVSNAC